MPFFMKKKVQSASNELWCEKRENVGKKVKRGND